MIEICEDCFDSLFCAKLINKGVLSGNDKAQIKDLREQIHDIENQNWTEITACRDRFEDSCPMDYQNLDLILGRGMDLFTEFVDVTKEENPQYGE